MTDIALALGGGGTKGLAHIGVLHRLEKEGYEIKAIAGTSIGGVIGAIYAAGFKPQEMREIFAGIDQSPRLFERGADEEPALMGLHRITKILVDILGNKTFSDLKIPFACTAVDVNNAQEIILNQGPVVEALLATIAIPGIFPPMHIGDLCLVDGGILDPVPVTLARWLNPTLPVIAISLSPVQEKWAQIPIPEPPPSTPIPRPILNQLTHMRIGQALQTFARSIEMYSLAITELRLKIDRPDVTIRPGVEHIRLLDNADANELFAIGEQSIEQNLGIIQHKLSWLNKIDRQLRPYNHLREAIVSPFGKHKTLHYPSED